MTDEVLEALTRDPDLYQRGDRLVTVGRHRTTKRNRVERADGSPIIIPLERLGIRERMTRWCTFIKESTNDKGEPIDVEVAAPWAIDGMIVARKTYPAKFRVLAGLSDVPIVRADGSLVTTPGYDEQTSTIYTRAVTVSVPDNPTRDDALRSIALLKNAVVDFPFETEAHVSGWLAFALTLVGRHLVDGAVPMFAVEAGAERRREAVTFPGARVRPVSG